MVADNRELGSSVGEKIGLFGPFHFEKVRRGNSDFLTNRRTDDGKTDLKCERPNSKIRCAPMGL